MPALTSPQLALLRSQPQTSEWYVHPVVPVTIFSAQINDPSITVGARVIAYDNVSFGAYTDIRGGETLWVGTAPNTYNVARIRVRSATSAHLIVAENSDVAWADNYYLTVKREWLCWSIRPFINASGTVFKDYDIAYSDQTLKWPPVAMMGDPVCKPWAGNPTSVYFDGSESYATSPGATITTYAWDFGDGTTSAAATPGNHNYTSAGDRWASLTVTDSNGKTCVTYRPVSLPDPATLYTAKFQEQSLDAAIDGGWTGQCSVFAPVATIAEFPERAPVFLIAANTYGGTAGAVGYPRGRENVVLFGYIQDDSVEETPETSSIQFTMESVDKVAARAAAITTFVADATTPANWDEGKSLNVFRSFVYLLAFQSTLFQIADVRLFNDTTLIKIARFPEDNLWNMFAQFARGARLMRVGVTRTGRVIVARDPNLLPTASRGVVTTVCQLQDGDWADTVTIPEHPYPATSFLCLSGIAYDGDPAHDPTPIFGMSPGHPPKEYGVSREIHDLALVNQLEANTLAGLAVGQDNNAFGEVNIPLWANWIGAFDPAYQEYVTAPVFGFVTNRGTLLVGDSLIVRKVSIGFDWDAGAMRSTLTCEVYSYPDIGMVGDCYTTDAPAPPPQNIPPVIPGPAPVPTNGANLDVWTLFDSGDIYRLTVLAPASGTSTTRPAWKALYGSGGSGRTPSSIAPSLGALLNVLSTYTTFSTGLTDAAVQHSINNASAYTSLAINTSVERAVMRRDPQSVNVLWLLVIEPSDSTALKAAISARTGGPQYDNTTIVSKGLTDYKADTGAVRLYRSTNGGSSWSSGAFLDYLNQLWATQMVGDGTLTMIPYPNPPHDPDPPFSGQTFDISYLASAPDDLGDGANIWTSRFTTDDTWGGASWTGWDARLGGATVGVNGLGGSPQDPLGYWYYDNANIAQYASLLAPGLNALIAPNGTGAHAYALLSGYQVSKDLQVNLSGILCNLKLNPVIQNPSLATPFLWPGDWNYEAFYTYAYKCNSAGVTLSSRQAAQSEFSGNVIRDKTFNAVADLKVEDFVYTLTDGHYFTRWSYVVIVISFTYANAAARLASVHAAGDVGKFAFQTDTATVWKLIAAPSTWEYINGAPVNLDTLFSATCVNLFCTTQGTVLVATTNGHVHRTTDRGQTWSDIAIGGVTFSTFWATESHGVIGGAGGPIVVPIGTTGKYVYSLDDGASWRISADISVHSAVLSNYAR